MQRSHQRPAVSGEEREYVQKIEIKYEAYGYLAGEEKDRAQNAHARIARFLAVNCDQTGRAAHTIIPKSFRHKARHIPQAAVGSPQCYFDLVE